MTHPETGVSDSQLALPSQFCLCSLSHLELWLSDGSCFVFTFAMMYDGVSLTQVGGHVLVPSEVDDVILVDRLRQVTSLTHSEQQLPGCQLIPPLVQPRAGG